MPGNEIFGHLESHRAKIEQTRENGARLARAYAKYETNGWGEVLVKQAFDFGCTFLKEPSFTSGIIMRGPLTIGRFPRVTAGVFGWKYDMRGYFTGAYVFFVVETAGFQANNGVLPNQEDPNYKIAHHMTFEGISFKDFDITTDLDY